MNGYLGNKKTRTAYELERLIQPTHFVTVNFKKGRKIDNELGFCPWVAGDDVIYHIAADAIVRCLSKALVSRSNWKRHRNLLPSAYSIEGGKRDGFREIWQRPHVHFSIQVPSHVDDLTFELAAWKASRRNPWVIEGEGSIQIEALRSAPAGLGYSLKEGTGRFMITGSGSLDVASN